MSSIDVEHEMLDRVFIYNFGNTKIVKNRDEISYFSKQLDTYCHQKAIDIMHAQKKLAPNYPGRSNSSIDTVKCSATILYIISE